MTGVIIELLFRVRAIPFFISILLILNHICVDLQDLLDIQLDKIIELLVVPSEKHADRRHVSLLLLHGK